LEIWFLTEKFGEPETNKNSTIEFSDDINFGGQNVKAGKYAIYTKPNKDSWEVYLYSDNENWGTPEKLGRIKK
jgi:hypothetical protein